VQKRQLSEPVSKRDCLLDQNQISELIMDSDSNEPLSDVAAMKDEEYCEEISLEPYLRWKSGYAACSTTQAPLSSDSASNSKEADGVQIGSDPQKQQPQNSRGHYSLIFTGPKRKE
jgi:hypothetical protein